MHDTLHYNTQKEIFHRIIEQRKEQIKLSCFTILDLWWSRRVRHNFKSLNKILVSYANHLLYYSCKRISLMEIFWKEKYKMRIFCFMYNGYVCICAIMSQLFAHFLSFFVSWLHHHPCQTKVFREEDIFCMSCLLPGSAQFSQLFFISKLLLMQKCMLHTAGTTNWLSTLLNFFCSQAICITTTFVNLWNLQKKITLTSFPKLIW